MFHWRSALLNFEKSFWPSIRACRSELDVEETIHVWCQTSLPSSWFIWLTPKPVSIWQVFFYERHFALSSMPNVNRCFSIDNAIFSSRNLNPTRLRFFFARKPQARQNFLELGNPKKKEFLLIGLQRAQRVREIISIPRNKAHPVSILLEKYIWFPGRGHYSWKNSSKKLTASQLCEHFEIELQVGLHRNHSGYQ